MDKGMVITLFDNGWSQAKIARRFKVSRARICQIINLTRKPKEDFEESKCEICGCSVKKKQYLKVEGSDPFLVCDKCKNIF